MDMERDQDAKLLVAKVLMEIPDDLPELWKDLEVLVRLLVWCRLDSWLDELLRQERGCWSPTMPLGP